MIIKFDDIDIQNAIYTVACEYEGFKVEVGQEEKIMNYFWSKVEERSSVDYGLERAISDYLNMKGAFSRYGEYEDLLKEMEYEVIDLEHCEEYEDYKENEKYKVFELEDWKKKINRILIYKGL